MSEVQRLLVANQSMVGVHVRNVFDVPRDERTRTKTEGTAALHMATKEYGHEVSNTTLLFRRVSQPDLQQANAYIAHARLVPTSRSLCAQALGCRVPLSAGNVTLGQASHWTTFVPQIQSMVEEHQRRRGFAPLQEAQPASQQSQPPESQQSQPPEAEQPLLFYLAADSQEAYAGLEQAFPHRLVVTRRQCTSARCDFRDCASLIYSLADMMNLARTRMVLGSGYSSFTEVATQLGGSQGNPLPSRLAGRDFGRLVNAKQSRSSPSEKPRSQPAPDDGMHPHPALGWSMVGVAILLLVWLVWLVRRAVDRNKAVSTVATTMPLAPALALAASLVLGAVCAVCTMVKWHHSPAGRKLAVGILLTALLEDNLIVFGLACVSCLATAAAAHSFGMAIGLVTAAGSCSLALSAIILHVSDAFFFVRMGQDLELSTLSLVLSANHAAMLKAVRHEVPQFDLMLTSAVVLAPLVFVCGGFAVLDVLQRASPLLGRVVPSQHRWRPVSLSIVCVCVAPAALLLAMSAIAPRHSCSSRAHNLLLRLSLQWIRERSQSETSSWVSIRMSRPANSTPTSPNDWRVPAALHQPSTEQPASACATSQAPDIILILLEGVRFRDMPTSDGDTPAHRRSSTLARLRAEGKAVHAPLSFATMPNSLKSLCALPRPPTTGHCVLLCSCRGGPSVHALIGSLHAGRCSDLRRASRTSPLGSVCSGV